MRAKEAEHINSSSSTVIQNYTHFHVSGILASIICHISLYYNHTILTSYLLVSLWSYTHDVAVPECSSVIQLHFIWNQEYMIP